MKKCDHCGAPVKFTWRVSPCALPKLMSSKLCADCDIALNALILTFFNVPKSKKLIRRYRKKVKG